MKFIDVEENGSNIKKTIVADKIKSLESLTYNTGVTVTVILFIDNTELHVNESISTLKVLLS